MDWLQVRRRPAFVDPDGCGEAKLGLQFPFGPPARIGVGMHDGNETSEQDRRLVVREQPQCHVGRTLVMRQRARELIRLLVVRRHARRRGIERRLVAGFECLGDSAVPALSLHRAEQRVRHFAQLVVREVVRVATSFTTGLPDDPALPQFLEAPDGPGFSELACLLQQARCERTADRGRHARKLSRILGQLLQTTDHDCHRTRRKHLLPCGNL